MKKIVDLRSDTITRPTKEMRQAMASALVGDDVFSEDPTVNELQNKVAKMLGKEAALFVPSGTMSNQIAIKTLTQPGDEIICEAGCHIFNYEGGAPAMLSGAQIHPLPGENGVLSVEQIEPAIRSADYHFPHSQLIEIENTHNRAGGAIFPIECIKGIYDLAQKYDLKMHLDGARLWNAHIATNIPLDEYGLYFDTISLCFSKGLGAPVGSILVGSNQIINKARRYRKMVGGGMRQVGILAAAALYALDNHLQRMEQDHLRARIIAEKLVELGAQVNTKITKTNIVIADFCPLKKTAKEVINQLLENGLLAIPVSLSRIRFVTHLDFDDQDLQTALDIFDKVLS